MIRAAWRRERFMIPSTNASWVMVMQASHIKSVAVGSAAGHGVWGTSRTLRSVCQACLARSLAMSPTARRASAKERAEGN
eukprot:8992490-Alexandrium_andersonii.AAC.1